jgi:prepilin-type N-terminal cleavage/methylation domain-containing protein
MKNKGFTLLETIIYLALFSVLMSGALVAVYTLLQSGTQNLNATSIQAEGTFINRKLSWALSGATAVTAPNTYTIIITRPDLGTESPLTITEHNEIFFIARGTGGANAFTNSFLTVANTNINLIQAYGGKPTFIEMRYTVNDVPFVFETYLKQ